MADKRYNAVFALVDEVSAPLKRIQAAFASFSQKADVAADKTNKLPTLFKKTGKEADKLKNKEKELGHTAALLAMRHERLGRSFLKADSNLSKLDRRLGKAKATFETIGSRTSNLKEFTKGVTDFGNKMTVGVTLPIVGLGGAMVKAAADMEAAQMQLSTLLGSEEKGAKMFGEIKTMAAKTPFGTKDLMQASNTMLGFGINAEKVIPYMQQLGDISGGNAERFQSLALAFSQVSSAGKLQGQDLMQMINAGFNPLEAMSKRTGQSIGQLKDEMSKGKITIQMVTQAMADATSEGGRFYKMMDKQSQTAIGQMSTLLDDLNMALAEFGKMLLPVCIKALRKMSEAIQWFKDLSPTAKRAILIFGGIAAALGPLISILGGVASAIVSFNVVLGFLVANPVMLTIMAWTAGIAALVAGVILAVKWLTKLLGKWKEFQGKKIGSLNLENEGNLKYLANLQAGMGDKSFAAKYDRKTVNAVNQYRQNNIQSSTKNNTNNYNFYGNVGGSTGSQMLDKLLSGSQNIPAYGI